MIDSTSLLGASIAGGQVISEQVISSRLFADAKNVLIITVKYTHKNKQFVLKRIDPFSGRRMESEIYKESRILLACEELGLPAPRLISADDENYLVMTLIEGSHFAERLDNSSLPVHRHEALQKLGRTIGIFHKCLTNHKIARSVVAREISSLELLETQRSNIQYLRSTIDLNLVCEIEAAIDLLAQAAPPSEVIALCHGDLSKDNIMYDVSGRIVLIDWADASMMPSYLDLASATAVVNGFCLSEADERKVIGAYEDATSVPVEYFGFYRALDEVRRCINMLSQGIQRDFKVETVERCLKH